MRMKSLFFLLIVLMFCLPALAGELDLTGVWECNDGGRYYLRQIGNDLWWYGESSPTAPDWSNIAYGQIVEKTLKLKWTDVPKGGADNHGTLVLRMVSGERLELKTETGGFSGSEWSRAGSE